MGMKKIRFFSKSTSAKPPKQLKKGVFFSIVSVLLVILFIATTRLVSDFRIGETELEVTRTRIKILNSVVQDMEDVYFDKLIYVSGKNALMGLSEYYSDNNPVKKLSYVFEDVVYDGVFTDNSGEKNLIELTESMEEEYTINALLAETKQVFGTFDFEIQELNITINEISQQDPWHIEVKATIDYDFKDDLVSWKGSTEKTVLISVYGMEYEGDIINGEWVEAYFPNSEESVIELLGGDAVSYGICSSELICGEPAP